MQNSNLFLKMLVAAVLGLSMMLSPTVEALAADEVSLKIAGGRVEDSWYAFAQALSKFINDKSTWLRTECVATAGLTANLEMVQNKPKEYIGLVPTCTSLHARPGHDWSKKRKPYSTATFITNITNVTYLLVTYDPNIKTPQDLKGKTVDVSRKAAGNTPDHLAILKEWGVLDDVKLSYTGFGGGAQLMMDGFCDATFLIINHNYPHTFSKGPIIDQLETKKPAYYLGFDRDMILKLRAQEYGMVPVRIPAKALDPKTQPEELWAICDPVYLMADQNLDPKITEEVTRVIYETPPEEWVKWHPQGGHMTTELKTALPLPGIVPAHPGTQAFYDKKNIKLTDLADMLK